MVLVSMRVWDTQRRDLPRGKGTWEDLAPPDWRKQGDDPQYDAIEQYFNYLYHSL